MYWSINSECCNNVALISHYSELGEKTQYSELDAKFLVTVGTPQPKGLARGVETGLRVSPPQPMA